MWSSGDSELYKVNDHHPYLLDVEVPFDSLMDIVDDVRPNKEAGLYDMLEEWRTSLE